MKHASLTRRRFVSSNALSIEGLEPRRLMTAGSIGLGTVYQTIEGFGGASTAWYHAPETSNASFYDTIVNDLGATGARGAVSSNFELNNDNSDPNVFDWTKYDKTALAHVLQFDQRLQERGASQFFLTVWTPPGWMKTNQSVSGGGSLRYDMRAEFAEYVAALVISAKRDFGVTVTAVSVQNEQFFVEPYESAIYDNTMLRDTVVAVQKKLAYEHLATKVLANEDLDVSYAGTRWQWFNQALLEDDRIDKSKLIIGVHATDPDRMAQQAADLAGTGVSLWYTEISGNENTWAGSMDTARDLSDTLTKANASAYYYWLYDYMNGPAETASIMTNGAPNLKYFGLKHFYKYVRPGMQRVDTSIDETGGLRLSAFRDPKTGGMTIVAVNEGTAAASLTLNLTGLAAGGATFRGFGSTAAAQWQSLGNFVTGGASGTGTGSGGGTLNLTVAGKGIVTLTTLADPAAIPGVGSDPQPIEVLADSNTGNPLRTAAAAGDLNTVNQLIAQGTNVNAVGPNGWTALDAAVSGSFAACEDITAALIAAGANINATTSDGFTPLHVAAMNAFVAYGTNYLAKANIVDRLVNAGANVNARDNFGRTPLMWATLTPTAMGWGPGNNAQVVAELLARGADRTLRDNSGMTAYDSAVAESRPGIAGWVNGTGADTQAPFARYVAYSRDRNLVSLVISEDVTATLAASDVRVTNLTTGQQVTAGWTFSEQFSNGQTYAKVQFAARLPDGRYRVAIAAGTFADGNGLASTAAITQDLTSYAGDANGDAKVDFDDLLVIAQNYGQSGRTYTSGDFNGDGLVNFDDLLVLAQRYGTALLDGGPPGTAGVIADLASAAPSPTRAVVTVNESRPVASKRR